MTSYVDRYATAKTLEKELLFKLNTYQPFTYFDIHNEVELPVCEYFPSMHKYTKFDFYNNYITLELKSRKDQFKINCTNLLDTHKIINNHSIFLFSYSNITTKLNDLHFIAYEPDLFETFYIRTYNMDTLFVIPHNNTIRLDSLNSHNIMIRYTEEYKDKLTELIEMDNYNYTLRGN